MSKRAMEFSEKKLPQFKAWLASAGCEILVPTNEWEILRFRAGSKTSVIYKNARGKLNLIQCDSAPLNAFLNGLSWSAGVATKRAPRTPKEVQALLQRDGDKCFLCGFPLDDDITVEHLVPVAHGGPNHLSNKALAHSRCNLLMGSLPLMEKIKLREHHQNWERTEQ